MEVVRFAASDLPPRTLHINGRRHDSFWGGAQPPIPRPLAPTRREGELVERGFEHKLQQLAPAASRLKLICCEIKAPSLILRHVDTGGRGGVWGLIHIKLSCRQISMGEGFAEHSHKHQNPYRITIPAALAPLPDASGRGRGWGRPIKRQSIPGVRRAVHHTSIFALFTWRYFCASVAKKCIDAFRAARAPTLPPAGAASRLSHGRPGCRFAAVPPCAGIAPRRAA